MHTCSELDIGLTMFLISLQAKLVKSGKQSSKVTITVDIQLGKVKFLRPNKDMLEEVAVNSHQSKQVFLLFHMLIYISIYIVKPPKVDQL